MLLDLGDPRNPVPPGLTPYEVGKVWRGEAPPKVWRGKRATYSLLSPTPLRLSINGRCPVL